eukprot:74612_1
MMGNKQQKDVFAHTIHEKENCSSVTCQQTKRVLLALKHYESLDMKNEKNHDIWIDFATKTYKHFIDDRNHMMLKHGDDIEAIHTIIKEDDNLNQHLLKCNLKSCVLSTRCNRNREQSQQKQSKSATIAFWIDVFDELHSFIVHAFDYGFRVKRSEVANEQKSNSEDTPQDDTSFIDSAFTSLHRVVLSKRDNVNEMNRLKGNKFTITTSFESDNKAQSNDDGKDEEESNPKYNSFSIGYTFYYWPHYKGKTTQEVDQLEWNRNDRMGHCVSTLFVEQKYQSLKVELLTNKLHKVNVNQYLLLLQKAKILLKSKTAKTYKVASDEELVDYYGLKRGSPITVKHLLAMICYTDFTELSSVFSSTFRAIHRNEPLSSIKKRNSEFWHMSKLIRETVECYGTALGELQSFESRSEEDRGHAPFYCGISYMLMPSFVVRICSPTSTTKQISVAASFCGDEGIILQVESNSIWLSAMLRTFNCVWLSSFPGEDERLLCGGNYPLRLDCVRVVRTFKNYASFCKALFYLDVGLNGMGIQEAATKAIRKIDVLIIEALIDDLLKVKETDKIDDYVKDTFRVFCHHKKEIVMNMQQMNESLILLKDTLFESESSNVVKFKMFNELFVHCKDIIFTEEWNADEWSIDAKAFASALIPVMSTEKCGFKSVTFKCRRFESDGQGYRSDESNDTPSWLHEKYMKDADFIQTLCKEKQINVVLEVDDHTDHHWDVLCFSALTH